jgi:hypothetical protein
LHVGDAEGRRDLPRSNHRGFYRNFEAPRWLML